MNMRGQELHDKATRGELLTSDEQRELEQWYAQEDRVESGVLQVAALAEADPTLQHQINTILDQFQRVTRQIQELSIENDMVRREIMALRHRLAQRPTSHAA